MPYEIFLALRYLRSRRRGRAARVTAVIAALTIAVGVAALVVAFALANGFQNEMRDKILRGTAHITVARSDARAIIEWQSIIARLRDVPDVTRVSATSYTGALLIAPDGVAYTVLRGINPQDERTIDDVRRSLVDGAIEPLLRDRPFHLEERNATIDNALPESIPGEEANLVRRETPEEEAAAHIIIGAELAERTHVRVGDDARIVVAGGRSYGDQSLATRTRRVRIAGIFRSDLYEYDATWSYVSLRANITGEPISDDRAAVSAISVEVADIYSVARVEERLRAALSDTSFVTVNWQEANRPLFSALQLERRVIAIIIWLIIIIAALNITTTLALVVIERRADIAILSAMGARARSIMLIFLIEGASIGAIGGLAGATLGLVLCFVSDYFKLVRLPADVYSISYVPLAPRPSDVLFAALAAFAVSLLATVYPAWTAARVRPAEILRYD